MMNVENLLLETYAEGCGDGQGASQYSPLSLAYLGDAVFELCVRTRVIASGNAPANHLHQEAKKYVTAAAQAVMYSKIFDSCSEEEKSILKRGRNAKSFAKAKHATVSEYRHATGLEALFGYLLLTNNAERIMELFEICTDGDEYSSVQRV